jgi:hypothetical protein
MFETFASDALITAPIIAFLVATIATMIRLDVRLPESLSPILSTFLLLAIGLKGGKALAEFSPSDFAKPLLAVILLGVINPVIAFTLFRVITRLDIINSSALAAHYGSPSLVTFVVLLATLDSRGIKYEGYVSGLFACLEILGIVVALLLSAKPLVKPSWKTALSEVVHGRSIALLLTGLVVGAVVGPTRLAPTDPFFIDLLPGVLTLFLIEMGVLAAKSMRDFRSVGAKLITLAILIPLVNGLLGALAGSFAGMSIGGVVVMATLAGSASFVAAPAVIQIALPQASPSLYLTTSIGVTFPIFITLGIPFFIKVAEVLN